MNLFIAGFFLSFAGSLPPGLISLSVARTAMARGFRPAFILGVGAALAEFFQAWFAVVMADWFLQHPAWAHLFEWAAIPVFWVLAIYLWFWAKAPKDAAAAPAYSITGQLGKGVLISIFNLLAIPYWFAYCGWLKVSGWWEDESWASTAAFSFGVTAGTSIVLSAYAWAAKEVVKRSDLFALYANRTVGTIFFLMGLKVLSGLLWPG